MPILTPDILLLLLQWISLILIHMSLAGMRKFYWTVLKAPHPDGRPKREWLFNFFMVLTYWALQLMWLVCIYSTSVTLFNPSWEGLIGANSIMALTILTVLAVAIAGNVELHHRNSDGKFSDATGNFMRVIALATVFGLLAELV